MKTRNQAICKHLADMAAVETHIHEAVRRQLKHTEELQLNDALHANVLELLGRIERTLELHKATLERTIDAYGGSLQTNVKQIITEMLGAAAGLYDELRDHKLSRMLRDDYTALTLASAAYGMLHTFGLAIEEPQIAAIAKKHLEDLTPLVLAIGDLVPQAVVDETARENDFAVDTSVAAKALSAIHAAWRTPSAT